MDKAYTTQLANIEKRTGKSLDALAALVRKSGLIKHGEIRDMLKRDLGMGHGDANTLVHYVQQSDGTSAPLPPAKARRTSSTRSTPAPRRICAPSTTAHERGHGIRRRSRSLPRRATSACAARSSSR